MISKRSKRRDNWRRPQNSLQNFIIYCIKRRHWVIMCRLWKPAIQVRAFVPRHGLGATFGVLCHQANWICSTDDLRQQHPLSLVQSPTLRNIPRRQMVCSKDPKTVSSLRKGNDLPRNPVRTHTVWRLFELSANQNLDLPPGLVQHRCLHLNTSWTTPADQFNGDKDSVTQIFGTRHVTPTHADDIICSRKENARAPSDLCEVGPKHHKCKLWRHSDTQSRECGAQQYHVPKTTPTGPKDRPRRHDQDPRTWSRELGERCD